MLEDKDFRDKVEARAKEIGAPAASIFKWRSRGIPPAWQIKLLAQFPDEFSLETLQKFPRAAAARNEREFT